MTVINKPVSDYQKILSNKKIKEIIILDHENENQNDFRNSLILFFLGFIFVVPFIVNVKYVQSFNRKARIVSIISMVLFVPFAIFLILLIIILIIFIIFEVNDFSLY
ncbi:hypothetical protein DICPUDRAFT_75059 [Dictyostelium purpureum]|uniref:Uncharacterized protein n=1 Tax=Dictyostelium purpureum TaxID=5786 RepID=F0Z9I6_DICPU|nr:uncharacterized protein DICPUDRAFT_75059 [Dictyostelium purpureum]EGC39415.1 hypothetical protein DICPUDRAFT_75059 [Dictyostelium purpureum]|eukprot:XP_003284089.1 hypothetical protein DICPUDRAFT_75059 [Dictyostelium purpureum]